MEAEPSSEQLDITNNLFWSHDDVQNVGNLIAGNEVELTPRNSKERTSLWQKIRLNTDFSEQQRKNFITAARNLNSRLENKIIPQELENKKDDSITQKEHNWSVITRSSTLLRFTEDLLRKFGIWGNDEHRTSLGIGELRSGEKAGKSNFAELELLGKEIEEKGYIHPTEGGPNVIPTIRAPQYEASSNLGDERIRRSLSHEIGHVLRALTNKNLWQDVKKRTSQRYGLRTTKIDKTDKKEVRIEKKEKQKNIGGFYVGSNRQGSEAVGDLFSLIVGHKVTKHKDLTIKDAIPYIYSGFKSRLEKINENPNSTISPYFIAKMALLDHLDQLVNNGFGQIPAVNLLSLGTFGYTSFEKLPQLIQLGIITPEKYSKMKQVVRNIEDWLTEDSQSIQ